MTADKDIRGTRPTRLAAWCLAALVGAAALAPAAGAAGQGSGAGAATRAADQPGKKKSSLRRLDDRQARLAIEAVMAEPAAEIAKDPSCKADLNSRVEVTVASAVRDLLVRAATDRVALTVRAECFVRSDYPLAEGEEYCRLAFVPASPPRDNAVFGLVFKMNWRTNRVDPQTIECF